MQHRWACRLLPRFPPLFGVRRYAIGLPNERQMMYRELGTKITKMRIPVRDRHFVVTET